MNTKVKVNYSSWKAAQVQRTARFSSYEDAIIFARNQFSSEVTDKTGVIAQFKMGKATEEFQHLDVNG